MSETSPAPHYSARYTGPAPVTASGIDNTADNPNDPNSAAAARITTTPPSPQEYEAILRRLAAAETTRTNMDRQLRSATQKNQKLVDALTRTKAEIERLRVSLAKDVQPPLNSAVVLAVGTNRMTYDQLAEGKTPAEAEPFIDVLSSGRLVRVPASALLDMNELKPGMTVLLTDTMEAVVSLGYETNGDVVTVREVLEEQGADSTGAPLTRVLIDLPNGSSQIVRAAGSIDPATLRTGDAVTLDSRSRMITFRVPAARSQELVLEEVPDITFSQIGGLGAQIEQIRDAVELPYLHPEIFEEYHLAPPKGILLYGPPGNGKTLIAKAVAHSLAQRAAASNPGAGTRGYFLNIKGPELLDKFVGETERQIRDIFSAARDKARAGHPVVVFFDEMESLFRTRGTGRSSDIETTIVPQLLAEIDGVESLHNVIVIGATNREDLIDAAVMRPGRLDLKIRINRPDAAGAAEIFRLYLNNTLPYSPEEVTAHGGVQPAIDAMIASAVTALYERSPRNAYALAKVASGFGAPGYEGTQTQLSEHLLYRGDFVSGAVIRNIVDRAKKQAIKEQLQALTAAENTGATGRVATGISTAHLLEAVRAEFEDQVELPPTPDVEDALAVAGVHGRLVAVLPPAGAF